MTTQLYPHIIADPDILSGRPIVEGTQVLASTLIGQVAAGSSLKEVARQHGVSVEDVRAALEYAAELTGEPSVAIEPERETAGEASRPPVDRQAVEDEARRLGLDPADLSALGRDLLELRVQGIAYGEPLLSSWKELDAEIAERRGSRYPDTDE
jgi:uncharacterized protein (DUF433 family)